MSLIPQAAAASLLTSQNIQTFSQSVTGNIAQFDSTRQEITLGLLLVQLEHVPNSPTCFNCTAYMHHTLASTPLGTTVSASQVTGRVVFSATENTVDFDRLVALFTSPDGFFSSYSYFQDQIIQTSASGGVSSRSSAATSVREFFDDVMGEHDTGFGGYTLDRFVFDYSYSENIVYNYNIANPPPQPLNFRDTITFSGALSIFTSDATTVPEPATLALAGAAFAGMVLSRRKIFGRQSIA